MIACSGNGKAYIGQSINIRPRWIDHRKRLNRGNHYNSHMQNSWNKHGKESFAFWIIHECSEADLSKFEQEVADYFKDGGVPLFNVGDYLASPARGNKRPDNSRRLKEMHADPILGPLLRRGATERASFARIAREIRDREIAEKKEIEKIKKIESSARRKLSPAGRAMQMYMIAKQNLAGKYTIKREVFVKEMNKTFPTIKEAALAIGVTPSAVSFALKDGRMVKGFSVSYVGNRKTKEAWKQS